MTALKKTLITLATVLGLTVAEIGVREAIYLVHMKRYHGDDTHEYLEVEPEWSQEEESVPVYTTVSVEEPDADVEITDATKMVPLSEVYRNFAYDSGVVDPESIIATFADENYIPPSSEGGEKLKADSDQRLRNMGSLMPLIHIYAQFGAASFVEIYSRLHEGISDEKKVELLNTYSIFAHSLLTGSFTGAKHLGLIV